MNTANLQLEGVLMAIAAINRALVEKGILSVGDLDQALGVSEQLGLGSDRASESLSPAHRDAIAFPARVLRLANSIPGSDPLPDFAELAKTVGAMKERHNDQQ